MPKYNKWLQDVIDAAEEVMKNLGDIVYKEAVYEEALCHELRIRGILYERQRNFEIMYKGYTVGSGRVDFIIDPFWATKKKDEHVMEIKAVKTIAKAHMRQAQVYMVSLDIKTGAVMSFDCESGILIEPLDMPDIKPPERKVCKPKSKKAKTIQIFLKKAVDEVYKYFGTEFLYRETTGLSTYENALGVELRLNGIEFSNATHPILYKCQEVETFTIPFVFADNSAMVMELYRKPEQIEENKEYYKYYANKFGIKKLYLGLIPEKEDEKVVFTEV